MDVIKEISDIQLELDKLRTLINAKERRLRKLQKECPHIKYRLPYIDSTGQACPRVVTCKLCDKFIAPYCEVNPKHICEYDTPDKKTRDWHDKCIHCGKLYEDN